MKKILFTLICFYAFSITNAQIINIPDVNFKTKLLWADSSNTVAKNLLGVFFKIDANNDGQIQVSEALNVSYLDVSSSGISNLTGLQSFTNLLILNCTFNNDLVNLDVSALTNLNTLNCYNNSLTNINLNGLTNLISLSCETNEISNLNVSSLTNLTSLRCDDNQMSILNVSGLINLTSLRCDYNSLSNINISGLTNLQYLNCFYNQLTSLDVSNLINLTYLNCSFNLIPNLNVSNLTNLTYLSCSSNQIPNLEVTLLSNLETMRCDTNQLTNLDVSNLTNLQSLQCSSNNLLTSINVTGAVNLLELTCRNNQLQSIDVSTLINLQYLICYNNQLTNLDLNGLTNLIYADCSENQLTNLSLSGLTNLLDLDCSINQLTTLIISDLTNLQELGCSFNQLTTLNANGLTHLGSIGLTNNQLTSLFMKNIESYALNSLINNPNLNYICVDEIQVNYLQSLINSAGYNTTCSVSSYCSFTPIGEFYIIQGNTLFDSNSNGCDVLDFQLPNMKYNITDGTNSGSIISNTSGNYSIPVEAGSHTITPIFTNPTYFNVLPTSVNVIFPQTSSPFTQSFCATANGIHPDLEVTILPLNPARPGFDSNYKIIYKNKGTTIQSGSVNLELNDSFQDFVSSIPNISNQTINNLSWDFTNLLSFESREIFVTINLNTPTETPPLNGGEILSYNAIISSALTDETPNDNISNLEQAVVNSFDPNDKTCLEGSTISSTKVGDYVHYMIRFENTGNSPAENIVVKDIIDTTKFQISTLLPISGSHVFTTRISETNKVEFIFQNINLPFEEGTNSGYVAFKIKTKSTLVLGNSFSNSVKIYFDYNFPINTNIATTTVSNSLTTEDFNFSNYFIIYPNPAKNILKIENKQDIEVSSISVYNSLGQLILLITKPNKIIDISELKLGVYFVKIITEKGISSSTFLKD